MSTTEVDPTRQWVRAAGLSLGFVGVLWVVEIVDRTTSASLDQYGIVSRTDEGLAGILAAPLLHAGWGHLQGNTGPLLVLGFLVAAASTARWLGVLAWTWLVSGVGVWLVGPGEAITLGASGLVFGLLTYLLIAGFLERRPVGILVAVGVFFIYGSVLLGVVPGQQGISWQGHLFGALGGVIAAYRLADRRR